MASSSRFNVASTSGSHGRREVDEQREEDAKVMPIARSNEGSSTAGFRPRPLEPPMRGPFRINVARVPFPLQPQLLVSKEELVEVAQPLTMSEGDFCWKNVYGKRLNFPLLLEASRVANVQVQEDLEEERHQGDLVEFG